ncbi:hypothetical protein [Aestuariibius sp. HNIBRBA575]|uniref:hypothetical protein n=1 Tax=Aestuariibius sp. HNIBRBA575 TaxID=3233343 RepID=UPI0034A5B026
MKAIAFLNTIVLALNVSSVSADQDNPLENISKFVGLSLHKCMDSEDNVYLCFETVMSECNAHVAGFAHNAYPCSTNTRFAFRKLVADRIEASFPDNLSFEMFQETLEAGYGFCRGLDQLGVGLGRSGLSLENESCLNQMTIIAVAKVWDIF